MKRKRALSRRTFLKTLGWGAVAGAGIGAYTQDCADWISLERHDLELPRWDANGLKLALLADFHMNSAAETARATRSIEMAIKEKPDLIVLGGDFVNHSTLDVLQHIPQALDPLQKAECPTVAVLGNHDYGCPHAERVVQAVKNSPVKLLRNQIFEFQGVSIAGVDDATAGLQDYSFFPKSKVSKSCLAILHEPDYVTDMPEHVSLQVSGHTHGGQVCLPFGLALHTPRGGRRYIAGYYPKARVPLYVTRGIGTVGIDFRLFCRPEVTVLTLRSA